MTWEEAKGTVARKHGFATWDEFMNYCIDDSRHLIISDYADEAAQLYAREVADKAYDAGIDNYWSNHPGDKKEFMKQLFPEKDSKVG